MWLTEMKRNALWCVRTRNFSAVIKIPSVCHQNFCQIVVNMPIAFPSPQLLRQFAGFTSRKMLHISQKRKFVGKVGRRITVNVFDEYIQFTTVEPDVLARVGQFAYSKLQSLLAS